tara:strand:- start:791 stop:967 length:177 start_codon:yes stop_codon:yes gene_type:complete
MKLSIFFAAALMVLFLAACEGDTSNMGAPEESNEDCQFGLDGNGNCLKEGASGIPPKH